MTAEERCAHLSMEARKSLCKIVQWQAPSLTRLARGVSIDKVATLV